MPPVVAAPLTPPSEPAPAAADSWIGLRQFTSARIALGRAGASARTRTLLEFRLSHARARDAVLASFRPALLARTLEEAGCETRVLATAASERQTFLVRPDLGRTLAPDARRVLQEHQAAWGGRDLAIIVSDGLSALAAERHAAATLGTLIPLLRQAGWTLCPILVAPFGRVKLQDEIGGLLGVRHTLMLLGERPGLGSPDSLGAYLTFAPHPDRTDADRNCVSNIRPDGLPPTIAGRKLAQLLLESARLGVSGVALKDPGEVPERAAPSLM